MSDLRRRAYRVKEAAELLAVSEDVIYAWLSAGVLRGRQVGRVWQVSAADVDGWFDQPDGDALPAVATLAARIAAYEDRLRAVEEAVGRPEAS